MIGWQRYGLIKFYMHVTSSITPNPQPTPFSKHPMCPSLGSLPPVLPDARPGCLITVKGEKKAATPDMPSGCAKHVALTGGFNPVKVNGEGEGEGEGDSGGITIWKTREEPWQPMLCKSIYA